MTASQFATAPKRRREYDVEALPVPILSNVIRDNLAYMDKGG